MEYGESVGWYILSMTHDNSNNITNNKENVIAIPISYIKQLLFLFM